MTPEFATIMNMFTHQKKNKNTQTKRECIRIKTSQSEKTTKPKNLHKI